MLTIEPEVFRGIEVHAFEVIHFENNPLSYHLNTAWKDLAGELDKGGRAYGYSHHFRAIHLVSSELLLKYWKDKLDFAREQSEKDGQPTTQPRGIENLTVDEHTSQGPWDSRLLEIRTSRTPREKAKLKITEVLKGGDYIYDGINPPTLTASFINDYEEEADFEVVFNRNRFKQESPFLIQSFKRVTHYPGEELYPRFVDERTLMFTIDRFPRPS